MSSRASITPVTALDDPRIADYARVGDAAWLREHGLFVAEGRLVVRRLLTASRFVARSILLTPAARQALPDLIEPPPCPVYLCEQEVMNGVAGFNFHRGCLALAARDGAEVPLDALTSTSSLLLLEGVGNPDNVGGIFRVAAAFGAGGVLLGPASGDPLYRKAIRTSMGASLRVPFASMRWPEDLEALRERGFAIVALTPDASAVPLRDYAASPRARSPVVLMLGAEGAGLSATALMLADTRVRIPITADVDSLNVVTAAGIALAFLR